MSAFLKLALKGTISVKAHLHILVFMEKDAVGWNLLCVLYLITIAEMINPSASKHNCALMKILCEEG